jgi:hypothetical protein
MVREIDLGTASRVRLWMGELPEIRSKCDRPVALSFPAEPRSDANPRSVAVEILVNTGPRWLYALLGAEFTPHDAVTLDVTICSDDELGQTFENAMALPSEEVRVGLLPEYTGAIAAALARYSADMRALGAGGLVFRCAAHGKYGSCESLFSGLGAVILSLLPADSSVSDELVRDIIRTRVFSLFRA